MANKRLKNYTENLILEMRKAHKGQSQLTGPLRVAVTFTFPLPKKRVGVQWAEKTQRGDIDKLVRAVLDAVTTSGIWEDDKQVVELHAAAMAASRETVGDGTTMLIIEGVGEIGEGI